MGPLPGRELLVEPGRRSGLAVGIAQERADRRGADEIAQLIGADYGFGRHEISPDTQKPGAWPGFRSEEHTSELQSLMRIYYAVFCLKKTTTPIHVRTL